MKMAKIITEKVDTDVNGNTISMEADTFQYMVVLMTQFLFQAVMPSRQRQKETTAITNESQSVQNVSTAIKVKMTETVINRMTKHQKFYTFKPYPDVRYAFTSST